jgi:hypothetical protein
VQKKIITGIIFLTIASLKLPGQSLILNNYSISSNTLEATILFSEDFSSNSFEGWEIIDESNDLKSNWYCDNGYLVQDTDAGNKRNLLGSMAIYNKMNFTSYVLRANVIHTDDDYIGVIFKYKDPANYFRFLLSSEDKLIRVDKKDKGQISLIEEIPNFIWPHCKFSITIFVRADSIKIFLNDQMFFSISNSENLPGKVGFVSIANLGSFFDDLTLYSDFKFFKQNENLKIERGPYLQNVLGDSATIIWRTNLNSNSIVEYYSQHENVNKVINSSLTKLHEIKLNKLLPSSEYRYRVISDSIISDWYSFKTEEKSNREFSFIIYSDTQLNFLRHREIVDQMKKLDFDFILHCGDAVQRGPRDDWDTEFFNPLKEIISRKPIYCAIGNHELNDQNYYLNFSNPKSPNESFYSFKYTNCFFIFLDNPQSAYPERNFYTDMKPGSIQYKWLENQLKSERAKESDWVFIISHVPSFIFGRTDIYQNNKDYLIPLFEKYGVDFNFSGHTHGYSRGTHNNINYIITAGGGGALNKPSSQKLINADSFKITYNFCHLTINKKSLLMRVYDNYGNQIDELVIKK